MIKSLLDQFNPLDYMGWLMLMALIVGLIVGCASFPAIINVAKHKHLMDEPDERSSHSGVVPNLGGIGIYLSIMVTMTVLGAVLETKSLLLILGGITILFFLGLKDDILILSPRKKFFGQLLAATLLIVFTDSRIHGFSGLFGVTIMPYVLSVMFTLFVYVLIINAINLIDGVDGLAGGMALLGSVGFGYLFYTQGDFSMAVLAGATAGALIPFLFLNFSKRYKMFMGDTGSMILGFILSVFVVRFIDAAEANALSPYRNAAPVVAMAILFFPLLDTFRIFFIRLFIIKKSPFKADKNHIHHRFLSMGLTHAQTTMLILAINMMIMAAAYLMIGFDIHWQLLAVILIGCSLYAIYFVIFLIRSYRAKSRAVKATNFNH